MTLDDLVGIHIVDGVGEYIAKSTAPYKEDSRVFLLRVDGRVHVFREDADDGYRSMLGSIDVLEDDNGDVGRVVPIEPRSCRFVKRAQRQDCVGVDDVLAVSDCATGAVMLEIGTEDTDDYYPSFISHWTPPETR